jgi:hypothetical protein
MKRYFLTLALLAPLAACATAPETQFIPSRKSAVELRSMQARMVDTDADTAMRGVVATLHDLGYRITRVEPDARTVSATRQTALRMAIVVQPRDVSRSTVRANATMIALAQEAQVDAPEFYQRNFFEPLGATLGRMPVAVAADDSAPEAARPVAEVNSAREREASTRARVTSVSSATPTTGSANP